MAPPEVASTTRFSTANKRKRPSKKEIAAAAAAALAVPNPPPTVTIPDNSTLTLPITTAFVSVSTEDDVLSARARKRESRRKAKFGNRNRNEEEQSQQQPLTMEDLEDVSFTNKDLQEVSTSNLMTNIVCYPSSNDKRRKLQESRAESPPLIPMDAFFVDRRGKDGDGSTVEVEGSINSSSSNINNNNNKSKDKKNKEPVNGESPMEMEEVETISISIGEAGEERQVRVETESVPSLEIDEAESTAILNNKDSKASEETSGEDVSNRESVPEEAAGGEIAVYKEQEIPSYLPTTWNSDMVQFYDTTKDDDLHKPDLLRRIPGEFSNVSAKSCALKMCLTNIDFLILFKGIDDFGKYHSFPLSLN
jgi:hypothetical protein